MADSEMTGPNSIPCAPPPEQEIPSGVSEGRGGSGDTGAQSQAQETQGQAGAGQERKSILRLWGQTAARLRETRGGPRVEGGHSPFHLGAWQRRAPHPAHQPLGSACTIWVNPSRPVTAKDRGEVTGHSDMGGGVDSCSCPCPGPGRGLVMWPEGGRERRPHGHPCLCFPAASPGT